MPTFTAAQFQPSKFSTAEEKTKFANHLARFLAEGCPSKLWKAWFYRRLSMTFGHIAHYDQGGFWEAQLASPRKRLGFLAAILDCPCYGDPAFTYSDVERAIRDWARSGDLLARYAQAATNAHESAERAEYERLRAKFADRP